MGKRIYAVAINTFREAVRDRVLFGLLGSASAVLLFMIGLGELSLEHERRVVMDNGLAAISLFAVIAAVFLGSSLLYKEIERRTLYMILPRPIRRSEFIVGKYFGIILTGVVFVAVMGAILIWVMTFQLRGRANEVIALPLGLLSLLAILIWRARDPSVLVIPWSLLALAVTGYAAHSSDVQVILAALALTIGELLVLTSVALLFSSFSTPFLTGILSLGIWIAGRSADDLVQMKSKMIAPWIKKVLRGFAEVIPNFNLFVPGRHALELRMVDDLGPWSYVSPTLGYAILYSSVVLMGAAFVFRRRDFL